MGPGNLDMQGTLIEKMNTFKHFGSMLNMQCELAPEIGQRVQCRWNNWRKTTGILCDKRLSNKLKREDVQGSCATRHALRSRDVSYEGRRSTISRQRNADAEMVRRVETQGSSVQRGEKLLRKSKPSYNLIIMKLSTITFGIFTVLSLQLVWGSETKDVASSSESSEETATVLQTQKRPKRGSKGYSMELEVKKPDPKLVSDAKAKIKDAYKKVAGIFKNKDDGIKEGSITKSKRSRQRRQHSPSDHNPPGLPYVPYEPLFFG
ncbi:hypothetical protein ACOME3_001498 [Neoechinorhynchus agilis]